MNSEQMKRFKEDFHRDYNMAIRKSSNEEQLITEMEKLGYHAEILEGQAVDFCKPPYHAWVDQKHGLEQANNGRAPDKQINNKRIKI